jgi:hypothetical protein
MHSTIIDIEEKLEKKEEDLKYAHSDIWLHSSVWDMVLIKDVVLSSMLIMPL